MAAPVEWRVAKCLLQLRDQINKRYPGRSKASDGTVGDPSHQSRNSDHNPWVKDGKVGVVTALDITHDPAHGVNSDVLAHVVIDSRDDRIKYVISRSKICSGTGQEHEAWKWRPYTGKNPHDKHFHVSCKPDKKHYDDVRPWKPRGAPPAETPVPDLPTLSKGAKGNDVVTLQKLLNKNGAKVQDSGHFDDATHAAVVKFQTAEKLIPDGIVGVYTWEALGAK